MKEKPILFSGSMVRAILEGRKTQTRRMMQPQPLPDIPSGKYRYYGEVEGIHYLETMECTPRYGRHIACGKPPYRPGDRLWVRETFAEHPEQAIMAYRADGEEFEDADGFLWEPKWTPSIHMPRAASRITLEVTDVRAERLQDISAEDVEAEGVEVLESPEGKRFHSVYDGAGYWDPDHRYAYQTLWEGIYGLSSWESNPWVWVIGFRVLEVKK